MKRIFTLIAAMSMMLTGFSQNTVVTDSAAYSGHNSAVLDVQSFHKGFLPPRMTTTQREDISSPSEGLIVFDTSENCLFIFKEGTWQMVSNPTYWLANNDSIYTEGDGLRVGVGTKSPLARLSVVGDSTAAVDEPLFEVKNSDGVIIFAVYEDEVKVNFMESSKGNKGGFAVGGLTPGKADPTEYLRITPDSVRVWIDDSGTKAAKGGFAVGGLTPGKGAPNQYLTIEKDSARIYVDNSSKGAKGGFAVGGLNPGKGQGVNFLDLTPDNYFIGDSAGASIEPTGLYNSFIGYKSGASNTTADDNVFMGYESGKKTTVGGQNVFIGKHAGYLNDDGNHNVFIGFEAGYSNFGGSGYAGNYNVFLGRQAGHDNYTGGNNTFIGDLSGQGNTTGSHNTFLGAWTGQNNNGSKNIFIGYRAGEEHVSGDENIYIGNESGFEDTLGSANIFIGSSSGRYNYSGNNNTFLGDGAGQNNRTGNENVILGSSSGLGNIDGSGNVIIGVGAGSSNNAADDNVFIGKYSGWANEGDGGGFDGDRNCFVGASSGYTNTSGYRNTYFGYNAGYSNSTGTGNVCVGSYAGYNNTESNKLFIHNAISDSPLIWGDFTNQEVVINGNSTHSGGQTFYVNGTAGGDGGWNAKADLNMTKDVKTIDNALNKVMNLRGVSFMHKDRTDLGTQFGFIGQEAESVVPELVTSHKGQYSMQYGPVTAILVEAMKEQQTQIDQLKEENKKLRELVEKVIENK